MLLKLRQKTTKCMRSASIKLVPYIYGKLSFYISNIYKCVILKFIYDRHPPPPPNYKKRKKTYSQHKGILSSKLHECTSKDSLP